MIGSIFREFFQKNDPLMKMMMDSPIMFILYKGPDFTVDFANTGVLNILDKKWEELGNRPFFEVFPDLIEQGYRDIFRQVYSSGETFTAPEMALQVNPEKNDIEFVSFTLHPFIDLADNLTYILGMATRITELVKSRELIQLNEEKYRAILESTEHGFSMMEILFDNNNRPFDYIFLEVNPAFESILGLSNATGRSIKEIAPDIEQFWIDSYGSVALTGKPITIRHEAKIFNSIYEAHAFRIGGESSRKVAILFTDVTDRVEKDKLAERFAEELQVQVAQRTLELHDKVFELRQFAHVMRHDMKEPLRKNKFFLSLLETSLSNKLNETELGYIRKLYTGFQRMETILDGVLKYSTLENYDPDCLDVDMNKVMHQIVDDLDMVIEAKSAQVTIDGLPHISGITMLIYQLFYNIIYNSLKFTFPGIPPVIHIYARTKMIGTSGFAVIYIKDNGIGFEPQYREKIFNPFTRLNAKDEFEGTGMGLAISRKIVERHGGTITADSAVGQGSEFRVILPVWQDSNGFQ
jgi:signal transduction histidine kinase